MQVKRLVRNLMIAVLAVFVATTLAASNDFVYTGSLSNARDDHSATLLNSGMILIAGGYNSTGALASAELYNPAVGTFTATGSLHAARVGHTATLLDNGLVLIAGGQICNPSCNSLSSAELYNPANGSFTVTGSMTTARYDHTACCLTTERS